MALEFIEHTGPLVEVEFVARLQRCAPFGTAMVRAPFVGAGCQQ